MEGHALQRALSRALSPVWVPASALWMRFLRGYRIVGLEQARESYRRIREESPGPLLICANHLTLIDSFVVAWALAGPAAYLRDFDGLPWNVPEARNFASRPSHRLLSYLAKCVPVVRGGSRESVAAVLGRITHLLSRGETALLFPEGGRSRTGRVEAGEAAWGVGRVVGALPDCRVLCVYLRGERQGTWSDLPARGDRFHVQLECIQPKSDQRGVRRSRHLAEQVVAQLAHMEKSHFDRLDARQ